MTTVPIRQTTAAPLPQARLPRGITGYILRFTLWHQVALAMLSIAVFLLSAVPLEIQRRIVNDAIREGGFQPILWLGVAYIGVALAEGGLKVVLNIYRAWISENAVRHMRQTVSAMVDSGSNSIHSARAEGIETSVVLSEVDPVGGFIGISISEPLLQGGILLSVFGYMVYLQPHMALLCFLVFSPQFLFVPLMQHAINLRAKQRIQTLREVSGGLVEAGSGHRPSALLQNERIDRVFTLNMGIYKLKYSMNFLMNFMYHGGITTTLVVGGWYAVRGDIEVGTVVAFLSGLAKVNDPWGDVVNWFREMTVSAVKYRLIADAIDWLADDTQTDKPQPVAVKA